MRLAIGSDHAGFELKTQLVDQLSRSDYHITDLGRHDPEPANYPDLAEAVGLAVR